MLELLSVGQDYVPFGIFFSYTPEQIAAIRKVGEVGLQLAQEHPEIAEFYRDSRTRYRDIAEVFLPDLVTENPALATKAVGFAVRVINSEEEQHELTSRHRAAQLEKNLGGFGSEEHIAHQSSASRRRHILHGVNTNAMIQGRGRTPWLEEERQIVLDVLIHDSQFQHKRGSISGRPNYISISALLNEIYHEGRSVRYPNSVASLVRDSRRQR